MHLKVSQNCVWQLSKQVMPLLPICDAETDNGKCDRNESEVRLYKFWLLSKDSAIHSRTTIREADGPRALGLQHCLLLPLHSCLLICLFDMFYFSQTKYTKYTMREDGREEAAICSLKTPYAPLSSYVVRAQTQRDNLKNIHNYRNSNR